MVTSSTLVQRKTDRVSELMRDRLGLSGSLSHQVRRGRRVMDKEMRRAAERLAAVDAAARQSAILVKLDEFRVDEDYRLLVRRLEAMPRGAYRQELFRATVQSALTTVLAVVLLAVGALFWLGQSGVI